MLKKKKKESKTIVASIEIIVLEYVMEIPRGGGYMGHILVGM